MEKQFWLLYAQAATLVKSAFLTWAMRVTGAQHLSDPWVSQTFSAWTKRTCWDVLKDYPTARVRLEAIAQKRLEKYKKPPLEKGNMGVDPQGSYALLLTNICTLD